MEEIRAYIESGVLELYVLGDISAEEKLRVETMALQHPAVQAELDEIEKAIFLYADVHEVEPALQLRDRVLNSLLTNLADDRRLKTIQHHDFDDRVKHLGAASSAKPTASIFYKYGFAASFLLLCASIGAIAVLYSRLQDSQQQLLSLTQSNQKFASQVNYLNEEIGVFRDPSYKLIQLKGTAKTPASALTVAWSASKSKVLVDLQTAKLPVADKNHQYQLWAIADGKPVDLGVFDAAVPDSADMKVMKSIAAAQAFAVTIEPRGGSVNPTMDQMVVIASL